MNKQEIYNRQYQLAKIKLDEWSLSDWLPSKETINKIVDIGQEVIDWVSIPASFVPGLNLAASAVQAASAGADLAQGQAGEAAWRGGAAAIGMLPGAAAAATASKVAKGAANVAKGAVTAAKAAEVATDAAKVAATAAKAADVATDASKVAAATKTATSAAKTAEKAAETATSLAKTTTSTVSKTAPATKQLVPYGERAAAAFNNPARVLARQYADKLAATKAAGKSSTALARTGTGLARTGTAAGKVTTALARTATAAGRAAITAARSSQLAKAAGKLALAGAAGYAATKIADALTDKPTDKKPKEEIPDLRSLAGVDLGALGEFEGGGPAGYAKSVSSRQMRSDPGEMFRDPWSMSPQALAAMRRRGTYSESYHYDISDQSLKTKVKSAVKNYLSSKEGKELNNHLNDIRKEMES